MSFFFSRKGEKREIIDWLEEKEIDCDKKAPNEVLKIILSALHCDPPLNLLEKIATEDGNFRFNPLQESRLLLNLMTRSTWDLPIFQNNLIILLWHLSFKKKKKLLKFVEHLISVQERAYSERMKYLHHSVQNCPYFSIFSGAKKFSLFLLRKNLIENFEKIFQELSKLYEMISCSFLIEYLHEWS